MSTVLNFNDEYSDFDPFSMAFRNNPHAYYDDLLQNSPGFMLLEGIPSAYVARHDQVLAVLRDPAKFSSLKPKNLPGMERVDFFNSKPVMNYSDPPEHGRLRKVTQPVFTPRRMQEASTEMARMITEILDGVGQGETIEVVSAITKKLAVELLLTHFLGVEEKDQHIFFNYVKTLSSLDKMRPGDPKPKEFLDAWDEGTAYCREALKRAAQEQSDNAIGLIYQAMQGDVLSDDEVMAMMITLLIGGVSTMASSATSALYHMAANPELAQRIRKDPALAKIQCEEAFRYDPPVTLVMRFAMEDVEIGGKLIRKGMPVYTMIAVANRDPAVFPEPDRFSLDRENMRQLSFGFGIHNCIGNAITRATVPLLVVEVANRYPNLSIDPTRGIDWETSPRSRHIGAMTLRT
ncbi:MAG: hypothetical protein JWM78_3383 [Verrucomicrobiaceae bacterium]|nr:hypothetical protein [Verrucomicrobiaceae bacterium]